MATRSVAFFTSRGQYLTNLNYSQHHAWYLMLATLAAYFAKPFVRALIIAIISATIAGTAMWWVHEWKVSVYTAGRLAAEQAAADANAQLLKTLTAEMHAVSVESQVRAEALRVAQLAFEAQTTTILADIKAKKTTLVVPNNQGVCTPTEEARQQWNRLQESLLK